MKLLIASLFALSSSALAEGIPASQDFSLNQETQTIQLETKEFVTVYRTDQVPATCYRSEVQGYQTVCHTEYDQQCHTEYQQHCEYRNYPVCQSVPRNVCYPREVCQTVMDNVCNSQGCHPVPRRVCSTQNQCSVQYDNVCHNESRYECQNLPQNICQNVPRQVCNQVPNVVQIPYACTKPVSVPIGQKLKLDTIATVSIKFENFAEAGSLSDTLNAKLIDGNILISSKAQNALFQVVDRNETVQTISDTEKAINVTLIIRATSVQKLNQFASITLTQGQISADQIQFLMSDIPFINLKGHLKLTQNRFMGPKALIIDQDFNSRVLTLQGHTARLMLNAFGVNGLKSRHHQAEISLGLDLEVLKNGLINTEALNQVNTNRITARFENDL